MRSPARTRASRFPGRVLRRTGAARAAALEEVERGELPALVVCHGMAIRAALAVRAGDVPARFERVPNGALIPLDPHAAGHAELGGGAAPLPS